MLLHSTKIDSIPILRIAQSSFHFVRFIHTCLEYFPLHSSLIMNFLRQQQAAILVLLLSMLASVCFAAVVMSGVGNSPVDSVQNGVGSGRIMHKKSFSSIGCLGTFDRSKFARLDRICEECYQIYRDQEIQTSCREFCFKNDVFPACVDALMLSHEQKQLSETVDELLGR